MRTNLGSLVKDFDSFISIGDSITNGKPANGNYEPDRSSQSDRISATKLRRTSLPAQFEAKLWQLGLTDGQYGQPVKDSQEIFKLQAILKWLDRLFEVEQDIANKKAKKNTLEGQGERLWQLFEGANKRCEQLRNKLEDGIKHDASLMLACIYLFVAFLLMIADYPLSLTVVVDGFQLQAHPIGARFLALGLAFSGIFIKFAWSIFFRDTLIAASLSPDSESFKISRSSLIGLVFAIGVFIAALFFIGWFRAETTMQKDITHVGDIAGEAWDQKSNSQGLDKILGALSSSTPIASASIVPSPPSQNSQTPDTKLGVISNAKRDYKWEHLPTTSAFTLITILLPLVGGICFAVGWHNLQTDAESVVNRFCFIGARFSRKRLEKRITELEEKYHLEAETIVALEKRLKREVEQYRLDEKLATLFSNIYKHGHERGGYQPEKFGGNESLYSRCLRSVENLIARKIRSTN